MAYQVTLKKRAIKVLEIINEPYYSNIKEVKLVEFFEATNKGTEVYTVNEPLLQKVRLLEEPDEVQKNSICNMIDTAIANKHLKEALSNAMSIII